MSGQHRRQWAKIDLTLGLCLMFARFTLIADVAACRAILILLGVGFPEKFHVSPLSILGYCFDVVSLGKAP